MMKMLHSSLLVLLFSCIVNSLSICSTRNEPNAITEEGRTKCRKACTSDVDCKGLKRCLCDGLCGMSCFNLDSLCPNVSTINNGIVEVESTSLGSIATYSCNEGFALEGKNTRTCYSDKQWSWDEPICVEILCNEVDDIAHGRIVQNGRAIGSRMTFECDEGYKLSTTYSTITCERNGEWSKPVARCDVACSSPIYNHTTLALYTLLGKGARKLEKMSRLWGHKEVALFNCNYKNVYVLRGSSNISCINGLWSDLVPECVEKSHSFTSTYGSTEYIGSIEKSLKGKWSVTQKRCKLLGGSLPILLNDESQQQFFQFLDTMNNLTNERHWLGAKYKKGRWEWMDSRRSPVVFGGREKIARYNETITCPIIGFKKQCAGRYCWYPNANCERKWSMVCQRDANPCHSTPCHNQGTCVRVDNNDYRCECDEAHFYGTNCERRRFCTAFESLPDDLIALNEGSELFHGVRIWPIYNRLILQCSNPKASLDLNNELICTEDGWNKLAYTCGVECTEISRYPDNMILRYNPPTYPSGSHIELGCMDGFVASGNGTIVCSKGGNWSPITLQCSRQGCSRPDHNPVNGFFSDSLDHDFYALNTTLRITCQIGFTNTVTEIICDRQYEWSPIDYDCKWAPEPTAPSQYSDNNKPSLIPSQTLYTTAMAEPNSCRHPDLNPENGFFTGNSDQDFYAIYTALRITCYIGFSNSVIEIVCNGQREWSHTKYDCQKTAYVSSWPTFNMEP